jgi:hypothetical protein
MGVLRSSRRIGDFWEASHRCWRADLMLVDEEKNTGEPPLAAGMQDQTRQYGDSKQI